MLPGPLRRSRTGLYVPAAGGGGGGQTTTWDAAVTNTAAPGANTFTTTNVANDTAERVSDSTIIATPVFSPNQSGKSYWETRILGTNINNRYGVTYQANLGYIGNFGGDASTRGITPNGTFAAITGTVPSQQTGVTIAVNDVVGYALDRTTKQLWWTVDGVTWWGAGGSTTNTLADVIAGTGGWTASAEDNRARAPGVSLFAGGKVQLLAGSNIVRSPPTGFTVLP